MQFETALLGFTIAGIPTIQEKGLWVIFPVVSILLVGLIASSRTESTLISQLLDHEKVLREELQELLGGTDLQVWSWGESWRDQESEKNKLTLPKLCEKGGFSIELVLIFCAAGLLVHFWELHWIESSPSELVIFLAAALLVLWSLAGYILPCRNLLKKLQGSSGLFLRSLLSLD